MKMKIKVETIPSSMKNDVYTVGRIPCHGEYVSFDGNSAPWRVETVIHCLNADPDTKVLAYVRVRE
jgi:hypothetical protein